MGARSERIYESKRHGLSRSDRSGTGPYPQNTCVKYYISNKNICKEKGFLDHFNAIYEINEAVCIHLDAIVIA